MLNHLIVLYNVFDPPLACTTMLVYKLREHLVYLKPFLIQLSFWPEKIILNNETILDSDVGLDNKIVNLIRKEVGNVR